MQLHHLNLDENNVENNALSTAEAVAITAAVVCLVCSFTAGLLLCALLTRCQSHCHNIIEQKGEQQAVYEDIVLEKRPTIELQTNEAYGHFSRT